MFLPEFLRQDYFALEGIWQGLETILVITTWRGVIIGI